MIRGIAYINRGFRYQIHATDREHESMGIVVVDANFEDYNSKVTIFDSGIVVIESPQRRIKYNFKDGRLSCE